MAKKNSNVRKPGGTAAVIRTVEDPADLADPGNAEQHEANGESQPLAATTKPKRTAKSKPDQPADGQLAIGDVKKAAAFANSIGGLDKAIALLQILKVAKEVQ